MSQFHIDIHVPGVQLPHDGSIHPDGRLRNYGRAELGLAIAQLGATVSYSRGNSGYDFKSGLAEAYDAEFKVDANGSLIPYLTPGVKELSTIHAIRNVTPVLGHGVPELNAPAVRAFVRDKVATNAVLEEAGVGKAYAGWTTGEPVGDVLSRIPGDSVVFKPRTGMRSQNVHTVAKQDAAAFVAERKSDDDPVNDWVVEEHLDLSLPIPIRGRDEAQRFKLEMANVQQVPKELRAYVFGREAGSLVMSYVVRAASNGETRLGEDDWVFIDTDTLPASVHTNTQLLYDDLQKMTGHSEMHLAIGWPFARRNGDRDARWLVMEVNGGEPQLVTTEEDRETGWDHARKLARQLYRVAQRGGTA